MLNWAQGLNLEQNLADLQDGHKAFKVQICPNNKAVKLKLGVDGQVYVAAGHSTLG